MFVGIYNEMDIVVLKLGLSAPGRCFMMTVRRSDVWILWVLGFG